MVIIIIISHILLSIRPKSLIGLKLWHSGTTNKPTYPVSSNWMKGTSVHTNGQIFGAIIARKKWRANKNYWTHNRIEPFRLPGSMLTSALMSLSSRISSLLVSMTKRSMREPRIALNESVRLRMTPAWHVHHMWMNEWNEQMKWMNEMKVQQFKVRSKTD